MTRGLALADGAALLIGAGGIALIARPDAARRAFGLAAGERAVYALRILGAMLVAAALFLGGFATAFAVWGTP